MNNQQEFNRENLVSYLVAQLDLNNQLNQRESSSELFRLARNFGVFQEVQESLNPEYLN